MLIRDIDTLRNESSYDRYLSGGKLKLKKELIVEFFITDTGRKVLTHKVDVLDNLCM